MLKKSASRGRTVGSYSGQNKDDRSRKEDDSHHVRSGRRRELHRLSSHARTVELQIRDPDVVPSGLEILARISSVLSEIGRTETGVWGSPATVNLVATVAYGDKNEQVHLV